jgi:hypothetical protein
VRLSQPVPRPLVAELLLCCADAVARGEHYMADANGYEYAVKDAVCCAAVDVATHLYPRTKGMPVAALLEASCRVTERRPITAAERAPEIERGRRIDAEIARLERL